MSYFRELRWAWIEGGGDRKSKLRKQCLACKPLSFRLREHHAPYESQEIVENSSSIAFCPRSDVGQNIVLNNES